MSVGAARSQATGGSRYSMLHSIKRFCGSCQRLSVHMFASTGYILHRVPPAPGRTHDDLRGGLLFSLRGRATYEERAYAARNIEHAEPDTAQDPREGECNAVAAVHDELKADEDPCKDAHDEHGGGPSGPCDSAEEGDEREDGDKERDEGQTRGEREEKVGAVDVQCERLRVRLRGQNCSFGWLYTKRLTWNLRTSAPE